MTSSEVEIGWREWLALPQLGIEWVKAKVDTGARTSCLHAYFLETFQRRGKDFVRFDMHPFQRNKKKKVRCEAKIADLRRVTDSGGHIEERIVIVTPVQIGTQVWPIELTLTNRETMGFRMLLGRTAISNRFLVNPGRSYLTRKSPKRPKRKEK